MPQTAEVRPGFVAGAIRRRWRVLVAGLLVGVVIGIGVTQALPVKYVSEASLFINPLVGNPYAPSTGTARSDQLVALQTEAALLATPEVATLAKSLSTTALPSDADRKVKASNPSNSQFLMVEFSAGDPEVAQAGAQAFAEAYLQYRTKRAAAANELEATQVTDQLTQTRALLDETSKNLATAAPGSAAAILYQQQVQVYAGQIAQLNVQQSGLTGAPDPAGEVVTPASAPSSPSGLPASVVLAACALLGLAAAVVLALAREHADNRIYDVDELTAAGAGHPLALVGAVPSVADLGAPSPEGYRLLNAMVAARHDEDTSGRGGSIIAVLGPPSTRVAEIVAGGLAATAVRTGREVLLVSAAVPASWEGAQRLTAATIRSDHGGWPAASPRKRSDVAVLVVASDPGPDDDAEFVSSAEFGQFLNVSRAARDVVVLSGGSSKTAAAWRMAELADLTVIAVELGHDRYDDVTDLVQLMGQSQLEDIAVVGVTATRQRRKLPSRR